MNNSIETKPAIKEPKYETCVGMIEVAETDDETGLSMKDSDTLLSMIVLLLACLGLAALAHVFV